MPVLALLAWLMLSAEGCALARTPFSGWLNVELVNDSVWGHCELRLSVGPDGHGSQQVDCRSDEGKPTVQSKEPLSGDDILRLRQLLRDADVFQGQFWGTDHRALDGPFVTLAVHDESRAAVLVCVMNESFEAGSRQALLTWLFDRVRAKEQENRKK